MSEWKNKTWGRSKSPHKTHCNCIHNFHFISLLLRANETSAWTMWSGSVQHQGNIELTVILSSFKVNGTIVTLLVNLWQNDHYRIEQNCNSWPMLIHCGKVMPLGAINLGQHWLSKWLIAWWHWVITQTNFDLSSARSCDIWVHPLGRPRSVYKSNFECSFLSWNDDQMTLKAKVIDSHFQYQLRESQDAYWVQIWWF